jgi:cytochrome c553
MFKKIILGLTVATSLLSAEETICFKIEGEMGKEIKALVEKYKGSIENITIKDTTDTNIQNIMSKVEAKIEEKKKVETTKNILDNGKILYTTKCQTCHGKKATKLAYNKSRALNTLTLNDMKQSIRGYIMDEYDRGLAILMKPYANILTDEDIKAVYQYIQTVK